jgi:hypothetical protein
MRFSICILRFMKIIPLSEGTFTVDKSKLFVPFNEQEHQLQNRPSGSLLVEIQPFVITTQMESCYLIQDWDLRPMGCCNYIKFGELWY